MWTRPACRWRRRWEQTETLHASEADLVREVLRLTNGRGVDVALEAVGRNETVATAIDCVRKGGTVTLVGNIAAQVTLPLQKVVTRQIRLQGSCASAGEYPEAMELVASGKIKVAPMISAVAPLRDGPQWFERLYAREPNLMKVILDSERAGQMSERALRSQRTNGACHRREPRPGTIFRTRIGTALERT